MAHRPACHGACAHLHLATQVEERELDQSKVKRAMAGFSKTQQEEREAERLRYAHAHASMLTEPPDATLLCRNRELAAVKVQKEDVDLIALEFEVDKKLAERRLREHGGNVKSTLISFL